jgi:hypothetical protein
VTDPFLRRVAQIYIPKTGPLINYGHAAGNRHDRPKSQILNTISVRHNIPHTDNNNKLRILQAVFRLFGVKRGAAAM